MPIVVSEATAPAVTGLGISGGYLTPTSGALKRIYHRARGFEYSDVAVTVRHRVNTTAPGADYQAGVIARRIDSANQIIAYVTNGGATPQLVVAKRDGDVMTPASVTITALAADTDYWLRLICDGNTLRGEHWTVEPTPMGTPATVLTTTLTGADATKFGTGVEGEAGIWWQPGAGFANTRIDSFRVEPYTYRNLTLPHHLILGGVIPGDLPALCDAQITPSGGTDPPRFGLLGWARRPGVAVNGVAPVGTIEAENSGGTSAFVANANAGARGGSYLAVTANGTGSAWVWWGVDSDALSEGDRTVEVFARIFYNETHTGLTWQLWADPRNGTAYGTRRYGDRGSSGVQPAAVTAGVWRLIRLGRIRLGGQQRLGVTAEWNAGTGVVGIDYLVLVPARSFAASPMGVFRDASYPQFAPTTAQTIRTLLHDGGATIGPPDQTPLAEHGLGRRIELPPGDTNVTVKLSNLVLDRPEADGVSEQLSHSATVHLRLLPRFAFA